jgi:hypothetical protein
MAVTCVPSEMKKGRSAICFFSFLVLLNYFCPKQEHSLSMFIINFCVSNYVVNMRINLLLGAPPTTTPHCSRNDYKNLHRSYYKIKDFVSV